MTRNPIRKVLSTLRSHDVRFLLMGGQACVFYGGAEFSRDTDIVILAEPANLKRLSMALKSLDAESIAVPSLSIKHLNKGHAVHFRCRHPEARNIRIDVMSVLRGVAGFSTLWRRRTTVETEGGEQYDLMSLPDLVKAKKTQRDKDWPMLRRLLEAYYVANQDNMSEEKVRFLLRELRTPELLMDVVQAYPEACRRGERGRPLLRDARRGDVDAVARGLEREEQHEKKADAEYWQPLRKELERLRHHRVRRKRPSSGKK